MLKLTDSGCAEHHARPITLTGQAAALVGRLVLNLPPTAAGHSYICEHGHTHCLTLQPRGQRNLNPASVWIYGQPGPQPLTRYREGEDSGQPPRLGPRKLRPAPGVQTLSRRS